MSTPAERVAGAFNASFARSGITLGPADVAVGVHRSILRRGWRIIYRVDPDEAGFPSLELYATHRMTSDEHLRIWADGRVEHLDAIYEAFVFDPKVPGSEESARAEFLRHNRAVAQHLRERGLYPEDDINAFLRTGGGDEHD